MSCKRLIVNQKMRLLYSYTIVISEESQPLHMQDIFFEKFLLRVVSNDYLCFPFLTMSIINVLDKPLVDNILEFYFFANILVFLTWKARLSFTLTSRIIELSMPPLAREECQILYCGTYFWTIKVPQDCTWGCRAILKLRSEVRRFIKFDVGDGS